MRKSSLALVLSLAIPASAAVSPETVRLAGENLFLNPAVRTEAPQAVAGEPAGWLTIEQPRVNPPGKLAEAGELLGSVRLADLLDHHRDLVIKQLGTLVWDISVAGDTGFKTYFLTFADRKSTRLNSSH